MILEKKITAGEKPGNPKNGIWQMFDRIAGSYDLLNHLLSFGLDILWRKKVASFLSDRPDQHVLDLATGTADQLISLVRRNDKIACAVGIDMSKKMLEIGTNKIRKKGLHHLITLQEGDVVQPDFDDNSFDAVTMTFGIRNIARYKKTISEMYRLLNTGGRLLILEFSLPEIKFIRSIYLIYFRHILPRIGSLISGDGSAYYYFNKTVETFPYGDDLCKLLVHAGFENVKAYSLTFGIATIYHADKLAGEKILP